MLYSAQKLFCVKWYSHRKIVYDPTFAKPYLGPVINHYGHSYTRLDFDAKEHPHHRSVWVAIGDVNGVDTWNEVDIMIVFKASYEQVRFGPTKEAGPLGIRVAESMKVDNGGTIINSNSGIGEEQCWGHRASWCHYNGFVEGNRVGITVFDNPDNDNYPTYWHVRNYGLLAPNNFYFVGGKYLQSGETMKYNYRLYFHDGDASAANVKEYYETYISPPLLEVDRLYFSSNHALNNF